MRRLGPVRSNHSRTMLWIEGPYGEEFAPDKSASAKTDYQAELLTVTVSSTLRRNVLGAIAFEKNDCNFPQRSDDNRDECQKKTKTLTARDSRRPRR
jgi:hypothetical protein